MKFFKSLSISIIFEISIVCALTIPYNEKINVQFDFSQDLNAQAADEEIVKDPYFEGLFKKFENSHLVQDKYGKYQ